MYQVLSIIIELNLLQTVFYFRHKEIKFLFEMHFNIRCSGFFKYKKVAHSAKDSELEALKNGDLSFHRLDIICLKRKHSTSEDFKKLKKVLKLHRAIKTELETINFKDFNEREQRALRLAADLYDFQDITKELKGE